MVHVETPFLLKLKQWVTKTRADPRMQGGNHVIVSMVKTDFDGAWRDGAKAFQKKIESSGVIFDYSAPERKEGGAGSDVNIFEQTAKAMLMERNLAGQRRGQARRDAAFSIEPHTCVLLKFTGARGPAQQQQARTRDQTGLKRPEGPKLGQDQRGAGNSSTRSAAHIAAPNDMTNENTERKRLIHGCNRNCSSSR
jgi:hypothetical protein